MGTTAASTRPAGHGTPVASIIVFSVSLLVFGGVLVFVEDGPEPEYDWPDAFGPVINERVTRLPDWGEKDELEIRYGGKPWVRPALRVPFRRQALRYELSSGVASYRASYHWTSPEMTPEESARLHARLGSRPPSGVPVGLTAMPWRSEYMQVEMLRPMPPEPVTSYSAMRYAAGTFGGHVMDPIDGYVPGMREEAERVITDALGGHPAVLETLAAGEVLRTERWSARGLLLLIALSASLLTALGSMVWAVFRVAKR